MADEKKTEAQLIAESEPAAAVDSPPVTGEPSTRRGLLRWIAPVLASLGTAGKVGKAEAGTTDDFAPVPVGRCIPRP